MHQTSIGINESSLCVMRGEYSLEISSTAEGSTALTFPWM